MKKFLRLTRLFACLCAVLTSTSAFAGAQWLGNSYINVNTIWYQAHGTESWASGGAFDGKNLGVITSLAIGGQLQIGDNGNNWESGAGDWMHYKICSGETSVMTGDINLSYDSYGYGEYKNNMKFQSGGSSFTTSDIDISSLSEGSTYTLKIWFGPIDEKYEANQSSATEYTATFTKAIDIYNATVTGVNASYDWTGSVIHPDPVVTVGGTQLTSSDYNVTYSDGCTNVGDYNVTITGKGNYTGSIVKNFSIVVPTGYYLVGDMNGWELKSTYQLEENTVTSGEYYINNVVLSSGQGFKVVRTNDGKTKNQHYPDPGENYSPGEGKFFVYFRPNGGGGDDWHYGCIYATKTASVDVNLAGTGYGTYYNSTCEVTLPAGVAAYVLNNATPTYEKIADGDGDGTTVKKTVPAGVAVLLYSESKLAKVTLNLNTATSDSRTFASNKLHGSDVETKTSGGAKYYKLTYSDNDDNFGWYWGAANGAAFTSPAHKAWLALPANTTRAFLTLPGDNFTGIATIENRELNNDNVWYDLNGRRIKTPTTKGIYVKDGRKLVIK